MRVPAAHRLAALLIAAMLVGGFVALTSSPWLRISSVAWAGSRYVSGDVLAPILDPLRGSSLLLLDEHAIAQRLAALPGVASASVEPRFPDGVTVQLTERVPKIIWQTGSGRLLVDETGAVFGLIALGAPLPKELSGLPLVDDLRFSSYRIAPGDRIPDEERATALELRTLDPKLAGSTARSLRVTIDERCGYMVSPTTGGWLAALGFHGTGASGSADPGATVEAQVAALRTLFSMHPEKTVGWVDARNPGKVYWRPSGSGSDTC